MNQKSLDEDAWLVRTHRVDFKCSEIVYSLSFFACRHLLQYELRQVVTAPPISLEP